MAVVVAVVAAVVMSASVGCAASSARLGGQSSVASPSAESTTAQQSPAPGTVPSTSRSASPGATLSLSPAGPVSPKPRTSGPSPGQQTLRRGDRGPEVLALQRALSSLGYWLGTPNGTYGELTEQAVVALQKAAGLARDGVYGPLTARALVGATRPKAHSASGHVVEINLARQLLLMVTNGRVDAVLDASTGSGVSYTVDGQTYIAVTPTGSYRVFRQVDGYDHSPLGVLWRPKYFNGGIAIHGYPDVPPYAASHGCVRVSNAAIDWIWASDIAPIGTTVLVY